MTAEPEPRDEVSRPTLWVVGPGFHFLGGLSVYTCRLANALAADHDVSVMLLRQLIPARLYPGGVRAGQDLTSLRYGERVRIVGELDWYWGSQIHKILQALRRERPDLLVLQWWTAATLHTYLALAIGAKRLGIPVAIEFHEVQDTGEASVPLVAAYCQRLFPRLLARVSGALVHNLHDRDSLRHTYGDAAIDRLHVEIAPHGPYDHLIDSGPRPPGVEVLGVADRVASLDQPTDVTRLLFFGLIRPYKGLEDLVEAFNSLSADQARSFSLTVVGETWEGWVRPAELIQASPHRRRITFVNRYVSDKEAAGFFAQADALVLPYRRGSASGPLQIAMSYGLHVVMSNIGGLAEAVHDYQGAALVPSGDVAALRRAILGLPQRRSQRFSDPHSWAATTAAIDRLGGSMAKLR